MDVSFYGYNLLGATLILMSMLYLSEIALPKNKFGVKNFFEKYQPYLSANNISILRAPFGILIGFYIFFYAKSMNNNEISIIIQLIIFLSITDRLDGQVARALNQTSDYGKKLDALCDKIFDLPILLALSWHVHPYIFGLMLVLTIVDCVGQQLRSQMINKAAVLIGKLKTSFKFGLIIVLILFLTKVEIKLIPFAFEIIITACIACFIFTLWSMGLKVLAIYQTQQKTA